MNVAITGLSVIGGLVGENRGTVSTSYVNGRVRGRSTRIGGLVGQNGDDTATVPGIITASYATGQVNGIASVSGLVGTHWFGTITASYWDTQTSGIADDSDTNSPEGETTAELQAPTGYTGIYESWNIDLPDDSDSNPDNPWVFRTGQYPVLGFRRTQAQINAQFRAQGSANFADEADINQDGSLNAQDAFILYQVYLGVADVIPEQQAQARTWQRQGRAAGGDINSDGRINAQDALIMVFAYQYRDLLQNSANFRKLFFNGLRGEPRGQFQPMPDTDATYREFLRRALRLR